MRKRLALLGLMVVLSGFPLLNVSAQASPATIMPIRHRCIVVSLHPYTIRCY